MPEFIFEAKVKETYLPKYFPIDLERIVEFITFPKSIRAIWKENSIVQILIHVSK